MTSKPLRHILAGPALIALAALASFPVAAAETNGTTIARDGAAAPLVIAQASRGVVIEPRIAVANDAFPATERGVREAASQGNEALRRYIWRTRMIYNYYYPDFASGE